MTDLSTVPFSQLASGGDFVLELDVDLVEAHIGSRTGSEATVGIERDPLRLEILQSRLDTLDDGVRGIDLAGLTTDAVESDLDVFGKSLKDRHVTRAWRRELHRDVPDFQTTALFQDRIVTAAMLGLAARSHARTSARRHRCTASLRPSMPSTT